jgi:hypothetical protein
MRSTYARVMAGTRMPAPPIRKRWPYLLVAALLVVMATMARRETVDLVTDPVGLAAAVGIISGFLVRKSMALTPWALLSTALIFYGLARGDSTLASVSQVAQFVALALAITVAALQLRVRLVTGAAALVPPRARWGSVLTALTATVVVIAVGWPRVPLVRFLQGDAVEEPVSGAAIRPRGYDRAVRVGRVEEPSLTELSGLAASTVNPGALWAHNDSGHPPSLYCLAPSGVSCGSWDVAGAENHDWEDIDIGPGPAPGQSYIYVGDIGDNSRARETLTIYRVKEPVVTLSSPGSAPGPRHSVTAEAIRLRYPDRPHDAETLLIHPFTGDLYIVTKDVVSGVYKAAAPLDLGATTTLARVARFSIFATFADRTGGDISPDGTRVVLATYGGPYEFVLPSGQDPSEGGFEAIFKVTPTLINVEDPGQLEAVTYSFDGSSVFLAPEGERSPMYEAHLGPPS